MIRIIFALLLLCSPAHARDVRVTSGEHDGFTRVVVQFPLPVEWRIGRSADGYELRTEGIRPSYDLSRAFDLIGRTRLAALWVDTATSGLRLGMACPCHALPFALRPDTIVIDLRDGPAPEAWSFEEPIDGPPAPQVAATVPTPWDWRDLALDGRWSRNEPDSGPDAQAGEVRPDLGAMGLEAALSDGFARAATLGLIDPVENMKPRVPSGVEDPPMAGVSFGFDERTVFDPAPDLSAAGLQCPGETRLAVQDWGNDKPIHEQMADETANLSGEFDQTRTEALVQAIKFKLFLGFGAEARGLMRAFDGQKPDEAVWKTLSYLMDGEADPIGALRGLAGCDDPAALWATIAEPMLPIRDVNTQALLRSFSALPPHLRMQVGPALAERFMSAGDTTTARALTDAILRPAASDDDRRAILLQVRLAITEGDSETADRLLAPLVADAGPFVSQVVAVQVELATMTGAPVSLAMVTSIEAVIPEADPDLAPALKRALALALALSGSFDEAFVALEDTPETATDVWRLLAEKAPDEALLIHALVLDTPTATALPAETRRKLAERLLTLGFSEAAAFWVGSDDPLIAARAALMAGQAAEVLRLLGPADGDVARKLKAEALIQIDAAEAVPAFEQLGDADAAERARRLAKAWPELAKDGQEPWRSVAQGLSPAATPATALARSRALADSADQTQAAVEALLAAVPAPGTP